VSLVQQKVEKSESLSSKSSPGRGLPRLRLITERWLSTADHAAIRCWTSSTTWAPLLLLAGNATKKRPPAEADAAKTAEAPVGARASIERLGQASEGGTIHCYNSMTEKIVPLWNKKEAPGGLGTRGFLGDVGWSLRRPT
jgi:hypothetical protein